MKTRPAVAAAALTLELFMWVAIIYASLPLDTRRTLTGRWWITVAATARDVAATAGRVSLNAEARYWQAVAP